MPPNSIRSCTTSMQRQWRLRVRAVRRPPPARRARTSGYVAAPLTQFSLSLDEIDRMRDRLRPWRAPSNGNVPRLCVDVRVRTSRLRADQVLVGCAPHGSGTRVVELGDAARTSVLLGRWTVDLEYVPMLTQSRRARYPPACCVQACDCAFPHAVCAGAGAACPGPVP